MEVLNKAMESLLFPEGEPAPTREQFVQTMGPTLKEWYSTDITDMGQLFTEEYAICTKRGFRPYLESLFQRLDFLKTDGNHNARLTTLRTKALIGTNIRSKEELDTFLSKNPWASVLFTSVPTVPVTHVTRPALVRSDADYWTGYDKEDEEDEDRYHGIYTGMNGTCACGCGEMSCGLCIDVCRCWTGDR